VSAAAVVLTAAAFVPHVHAQARDGALHLLDVPYLPQSEALCGGAAAAMVMRYWGATGIYAEAFAELVDPVAEGIRGEDLLRALQSRGWKAASLRGDPPIVQSHLAERVPVVALLQDRPGRFHYVVVVGWSRGRVIVHDPARAPFRVLDDKTFTEAWAHSGNWTLVVTPSSETVAPPGPALPPVPPDSAGAMSSVTGPCSEMVGEGIRLAGSKDIQGARRLFEVAAENCPGSPAPWRELAGLHALGSAWREAAADARRALARDASDPLASRILATALYLEEDPDGALDAWNRVGEPVVDLVNVVGLERTRYRTAARLMGLQPQTLLTRGALQAARRRLAELPAAQTTRVGYRPGGGRAQVEAVVLERPLFPSSPVSLAAAGLRMITDRELVIGLASPSGGGELWTAAWRWWERRPRVSLGFASPAPFGGVWRADIFDERQTYANDGRSTIEEARRYAGFHVSDWTRRGFRWDAGVAVDRWRGAGRAVALTFSGQQRLAGDRAYVEGRAGAWRGGVRAWTLGLRTEWRSHARNEGHVSIARAGGDLATEGSPLALWPGAGTGQGREVMLRAHPLLDGGTIRDGVFGRALTHGGLEWRRWMQPARRPIRIAPALFVDAARAVHGLESSDERWHSDVGAGIRIAVPGAGVVRIDLARGLRDGAMALSAGWAR
jgi:hypothetical protein